MERLRKIIEDALKNGVIDGVDFVRGGVPVTVSFAPWRSSGAGSPGSRPDRLDVYIRYSGGRLDCMIAAAETFITGDTTTAANVAETIADWLRWRGVTVVEEAQ